MKSTRTNKTNLEIGQDKNILKEHLVTVIDKVDITKIKYYKKGPIVMQLAFITFLDIKLYYLSILLSEKNNKIISKAYISEDNAMTFIADVKTNKIKL